MSTNVVYREHPRTGRGPTILNWMMKISPMLARPRRSAALSDLDDRLLRDIGLARADLETMRRS